MPTERSLTDPEKLSYWIQRSDFTYTQESSAITLDKAKSLLRRFDWKGGVGLPARA